MYIHPYLYNIIQKTAEAMVQDRVYPLCAPAGAGLPFITYRVDETQDTGTKDAQAYIASVEVACVGKSLEELHTLADSITTALENDEINANEYGLDWPRWQNTSEMYDATVDGYVIRTTINYKATR